MPSRRLLFGLFLFGCCDAVLSQRFSKPTYSFSVYENSDIGTSVGRVALVDLPSVGAATSYTLYPKLDLRSRSLLRVDTSGQVWTARSLDRELLGAKHEYELSGIVSGVTRIATLIVTILDRNDNAPVFSDSSSAAHLSVREDVAVRTVLVTLHASDIDAGDNRRVTYRLVSGNTRGAFELNGTSGQLRTANLLDRETTDSYELVVEARDHGTPSLRNRTTIRLTVTDVNDNPPIFEKTSHQLRVREDVAKGSPLLTLTALDSDVGTNGQVRYSITEGNWRKRILIDATKGSLSLGKRLDFERYPLYKLTVVAVDGGGLSGTASVQITVVNVNDESPKFPSSFQEGGCRGKQAGKNESD